MSLPEPTHRRGFTLTELLVVIAIIATLAALASVGIMAAMSSVRATAIKVELDQIDAAMKRYKDTYGSYPPCNLAFDEPGLSATDKARRLGMLRQHLAMAFPRYTADEARLRRDLTAAGIDLQKFRPDQALVFWLQGFSADPTSPILSTDNKQIDNSGNPIGAPQKRTNNFFEFDRTRLVAYGPGADPAPSYFPTNARIATTNPTGKTYAEWSSGHPPIVYFDAKFYGADPVYTSTEAQPNQFNTSTVTIFPDAGVAMPYWHDRNGNGSSKETDDQNSQETWANPDSFQLIASGADGKYGLATPSSNAKMYPTGVLYDLTTMTDDDNCTNFTNGKRLGDDIP